MCRDKASRVNMESRKELDLNEFPPDEEQHEQPFQEEKLAPTKKRVHVDLDETFSGMDYAFVTPTKLENEMNQFAQTEWNSKYPHQTHQTLSYVQALEAGPSDPGKVTGFARAVQPKTNGVQDDIRRGTSSRDPKPKLKLTNKITPKPENPQESSYTMPKELQIFYAQQFQQQQLNSQSFQPKQLYSLPFHLQQLYAQLLQRQQRYAWLIQQEQLDARSLRQQQLDARPLRQQQDARSLQQQQLHALPLQQQQCAQPFQQQQLHAQPFQLQQQHPSSSAVKAEAAGSSDHPFANIIQIGCTEHPQSTGNISIPCRSHCPYLHDMSARLENHDIFDSSNNKNKSKKMKKRDEGDCSCPECQNSAMHIRESSGDEYFTPLTLRTLEEIRMRVREKIK